MSSSITDESIRRAEAVGFSNGTWDRPPHLELGQITTARRMPTVELLPGPTPIPIPVGPPLDIDSLEFDDPLTGRPMSSSSFLDRRLYIDALAVFHEGGLRYEKYRSAMTENDHHIVHSVTKSLTSMAFGRAVADGFIDVNAEISEYVASLRSNRAWNGVTVQHVLDMATGIDFYEDYDDRDSAYWAYASAVGYYGDRNGIGAERFVAEHMTKRGVAPGSLFNYASPQTNLLAMCLTNATGKAATDWYESMLYRSIGAERPALFNCDRFGVPIAEGHLNLTLRDLLRWSLLLLDDGRNLRGEQVIPAEWVAETTRSHPNARERFDASEFRDLFPGAEYHNQTWMFDASKGQIAMLGIHGQFVYIDRPRRLVIAALASYPVQVDPMQTAATRHFRERITEAIDR